MQVKKFSELKAKFMRSKRRQIATAVMVALTVLLVLLAVLEFFLVLRVSKIVIKGESPYSYEELEKIFGVEKGDFMYSFDKDDIEERILESAPYIKNVKASRVFSRLVIKVESDTAKYYMKISDKSNEYYILSQDMRVLDCKSNIASVKEEGLVYIELPHLATCSVGRYIEYSEPKKCEYVKETLDYLMSKEYSGTITAVGLSNRFDDCYVDFYGKCRIIFGKPQNLEEKINKATEILKKFASEENVNYIIIDVSDPNKAIYSIPESLE